MSDINVDVVALYLGEEHDGLHVAADSDPVRKPSWRECCSTPARPCSAAQSMMQR